MRYVRPLAALGILATSAFVACGDDEGTGGGTTTTTTTSGSTTTGEMTTTTSSTTVTSSSTGMMLKALGASCAENEECEGGVCLTEEIFGWAQGYCTALCDPTLAPCAEGICLSAGSSNVCIKECKSPADCPGVANECATLDLEEGPVDVCLGGCSESSQCTTTMNCVIEDGAGLCIPPEVCDQPEDEDGDGLINCEDSDCATDCATEIDAACNGAPTLTLGANAGTTSGDSVFASTCTGGGAPEDVFEYTAAQTGYLLLTLDSTGDLGIAVRSTCDDGATEIGCTDIALGGETESLAVEVTMGGTVNVFVDGYAPGREGDYTLNASFSVPTAESEPNDTSATADAAVSGVYTGSVNPDTDEDWFVVTLAAPADLTATTLSRGANICEQASLDSLITIFEADATTVVAENDDINPFGGNFCSSASGAALPAGTYYVRVRLSDLASAGTTFDYGLQISVQ
jgi:hypothetical protein